MDNATPSDLPRESPGALAADQLLPLVYDELRRLAATRLAAEQPGQTLDATALVHEAYLKLLGPDQGRKFTDHRHFFLVAAEAMRQILIDRARRRLTVRHGGQMRRIHEPLEQMVAEQNPLVTLALDELLEQLAQTYARPAQVARLRLYLELTFREIGEVLELSADTAENDWAFARAWLKRAWQAG